MKEVFLTEYNDKILVTILKREANIILASLDKYSNEYLYKKELFKDTIDIAKSIEAAAGSGKYEISFIVNTIKRILSNSVLSPLTLKEDEFMNYPDEKGYIHNIRYNDIYIDNTLRKSICNDNAFNVYVRAAYSHDENIQIECTNEIVHGNSRIYISKGGIITGEYIEKCIIRQNIVDKHCFTIKSIPNIPVSIIVDGDDSIYVTDHREPKLKALQEFYEVPIYKDYVITDKHYNIRKYNKLK